MAWLRALEPEEEDLGCMALCKSLVFPASIFPPANSTQRADLLRKPQITFFKNKFKNQVLGTSQLRCRGCEIPLLRALCKPSNEEEGGRKKESLEQAPSHKM